jgi:hypothetical protein
LTVSALLGVRLGPYEILAPVGAGGMGEVYRARDTRLGREVAVKVLPPHLLDSPDALARFEREARAVAALNHPNILALHDIGREGPISYAVTELLEGETLRSRIAAGPIPPRRALDVLVQVARGLGAAHDRGIVHRDIKPENLFLTTDGRVKILDFGISTQAERTGTGDVTSPALTEPGMLVGTPTYMAPEQLLAQTATTRSDIFAFGVVASEILTGVHPFKRPTPAETTIAILRQEPTPLGPVAAALPPGVAPILARCLEKQPGDRPGSARDLSFFFETLGGLPEGGASNSVAVRTDAMPQVRRRVLTTSVSLLLLVVALTWGYVGFMAERTVNDVVEADLARAERLVHRVHEQRLTLLVLMAQNVASFPALKEAFVRTDPATVAGILQDQQTGLPGTPLLVALTAEGKLLARSDGSNAPPAQSDTWQRLVVEGGDPAVVTLDGRLYHDAGVQAQAAGSTFGYVMAAVPVDQAFAQSLREATQDEIVLLASGVLGTTLRGSPPWTSIPAWRDSGGTADRAMNVDLGSQRFAAREVPLSDRPPLSVIVAKSRDDAIAPFRSIQAGLLLVGVLAAALAIAGAFWMSRSIRLMLHSDAR